MVVYDDKCMLKYKTWKWPFTAARAQHSSHTHSITPLLKYGKRERGHWCFTNTVWWVKISGQLTETGREFSLCVLPGFQHHQGEKPLKELLEMLPANEPYRDPPSTLGLAGTPCAPALPAGSPSLAGRKQMMHSWLRLYFPNTLLHHRKCQITILGQLPRLLYACWCKV